MLPLCLLKTVESSVLKDPRFVGTVKLIVNNLSVTNEQLFIEYFFVTFFLVLWTMSVNKDNEQNIHSNMGLCVSSCATGLSGNACLVHLVKVDKQGAFIICNSMRTRDILRNKHVNTRKNV
ncbi:hypothetical protein TNIN_335561 [Trichonephila inaurata madagascariensis]|uniref:Uncharacterized protein n=1 Tax=Trichonephila inaurata madagascariensis TaxID=2747483 RepID=A0A8X6WRY8_9ARAC|nr:hypothetical protein TNIN_335561 [Trichonephila inaurata madagascariensis]